jgi:hypothetical protein
MRFARGNLPNPGVTKPAADRPPRLALCGSLSLLDGLSLILAKLTLSLVENITKLGKTLLKILEEEGVLSSHIFLLLIAAPRVVLSVEGDHDPTLTGSVLLVNPSVENLGDIVSGNLEH